MAEMEYNSSKYYNNIRIFTAQLIQSNKTFFDLHGIKEHWSVPSPRMYNFHTV